MLLLTISSSTSRLIEGESSHIWCAIIEEQKEESMPSELCGISTLHHMSLETSMSPFPTVHLI